MLYFYSGTLRINIGITSGFYITSELSGVVGVGFRRRLDHANQVSTSLSVKMPASKLHWVLHQFPESVPLKGSVL